MGGRGTFAFGKIVPYRYKSVGKLYNTKILEGFNGTHGLPEESHSSSAYISLNHDGSVRQLRVYNNNSSILDIDNSQHQGIKSLHAHDYINGERQAARDLTEDEFKKYEKYFKGR